ncbi:hypothetical protein ACLKA7_005482 [Drosophila subpalustris]
MVDTSQVAFAAAAYLRITNGQESDIVFIMGKTRLAPKKLLSIPRLELQAAVLGVHHHLTLTQTTFWSDSMTVLQWINSTSRRFKPFVGHRVAEIISTTLLTNGDGSQRSRTQPMQPHVPRICRKLITTANGYLVPHS